MIRMVWRPHLEGLLTTLQHVLRQHTLRRRAQATCSEYLDLCTVYCDDSIWSNSSKIFIIMAVFQNSYIDLCIALLEDVLQQFQQPESQLCDEMVWLWHANL